MVVGGSDELSGQSVFGSGGNLGFGRDGSHAEYVAVPSNAVCLLPRNLGFEQAGGVGVAYITAGLRREEMTRQSKTMGCLITFIGIG